VQVSSEIQPLWLTKWLRRQGITLWGGADLRAFPTPADARGRRFPRALSFAIPMDPQIMAATHSGPNQAYAEAYDRVNARLNHLADRLVAELGARGFAAQALAASARTDPVNLKGDFPHKTAATQAGLGWIGRNCQLITRKYGPWVRLGTVFTDMALSCGPAVSRHFCGDCRRCVAACPAGALTGTAWQPGLPREEILSPATCDRWKKANYLAYHQGHVCGICAAVCPYGQKVLVRRKAPKRRQNL
jgi:epoxyqueuosine reductase